MRKTTCLLIAALLGGCAATSVPPNFLYETSLRGEQGFIGRAERLESAESLLEAGGVSDPSLALAAALPDRDVEVKRWGLKYFGSDWTRYQTVLDANIKDGDETVKCRLATPENHDAAPTLDKLRANEGVELQRRLDELVKACTAKAGEFMP